MVSQSAAHSISDFQIFLCGRHGREGGPFGPIPPAVLHNSYIIQGFIFLWTFNPVSCLPPSHVFLHNSPISLKL